jgi:hypothetical protein
VNCLHLASILQSPQSSLLLLLLLLLLLCFTATGVD